MKTMRNCNDEIYQLAKDQALVKKLKNKRFRLFCLCPPDVMFVTHGSYTYIYIHTHTLHYIFYNSLLS